VAARDDGQRGPRRIVVRASESVVRVGEVTEVFGATDRVVVCLERNGADLEELLVLRLRHGIYAMVNRCPHLERALDDGRVYGHILTCPGHGRSYNVRSGRAAGTLPGSGRSLLRRVRAWTDDGQLFLDITGF
jgi:nitrite reductase/ring-hydroxylating ferredoxin subunit